MHNKQLEKIQFKNKGIVRKDMLFEYRTRPCHYMEDVDQWATRYGGAYFNYLYQIEEGNEIAPPNGMRSSVPLGGMGAGTFELRADGSLKDWTIFNNSPAGGSKIQLDNALFYLWVKQAGKDPVLKTLRTHPPVSAPAIEQIEYSGAYPVSRLVYTDSQLPVKLTLYAMSEYHIYREKESATPAVSFNFVLENLSEEELDVSLMFVLPNGIEGEYDFSDQTLELKKEGTGPTGGNMAVQVKGPNLQVTGVKAESLLGIQRDYGAYGEFPAYVQGPQKENPIDGAVGRMYYEPRLKKYGCLSAKTTLKAHTSVRENSEINFVLAWHFPHRPHAGEILGNYYTHLYSDAKDTAVQVMERIPQTIEGALNWQSLCFNNTLPTWLQDGMVNSTATLAKTGMWFKDERWRQWESFSCPGVDPIHIQFYRVLPYAWWFKEWRRSQMYGFKSQQQDDGYIQENLGRGTDVLDKPIGRMIGDACTTFTLQAYQDYLWTGEKHFFNDMWPAVKKAMCWQIKRAEKIGFPHNQNNTYDWWEFENQDGVSYNAFLHLSALLAAEKMADFQGDKDFSSLCKEAFHHSRKAVDEVFWNGEYYLAYKNMGQEQNSLLSDTLYGQLWADILGLGLLADEDKLKGHLSHEQKINGTPYGLKVMHREGRESDALSGMLIPETGEKPRDEIVWEGGSLDWCSLNLSLGGSVAESLAEAEKIFTKWQDQLKDQWDIRDLSTAWNGEPYCNSHYGRQVILWAIPLALSGQKYSAIEGILSFEPRIEGECQLPFMTPQGSGILELDGKGGCELLLLAGSLDLKELVINGKCVGENICLSKDEYFES